MELARTFMELCQYGDAEALVNEMLRDDPVSVPARHLQVNLLVDTGRAAAAAAVAETLLADYPDDAAAHATLAWVALKSGRPHDALTAYENALRVEPGHLDFTAVRAMALKRLRRDSEALSLMSAIIERDAAYFDHNRWCAELTALSSVDEEHGA